MKIRSYSWKSVCAVGALALLGSSLAVAPACAQDAPPAGSDKPVSLNLNNVPIRTALEVLFKSAGIRQYTIAQDVQGQTTIALKDQPFSTALNQLLGAAFPPATFTELNGVYNVTVKRAAVTPPTTVDRTTVTNNDGSTDSTTDRGRFYRIPIDKYDAYVIAQLLGAQGIVDVPTNITRQTGGGGGQQGQGGFGGGFGGQQGGFGGLSNGVSSVGGFGGQQGGFGGGFGGGGGGGYGGGGRGGRGYGG